MRIEDQLNYEQNIEHGLKILERMIQEAGASSIRSHDVEGFPGINHQVCNEAVNGLLESKLFKMLFPHTHKALFAAYRCCSEMGLGDADCVDVAKILNGEVEEYDAKALWMTADYLGYEREHGSNA